MRAYRTEISVDLSKIDAAAVVLTESTPIDALLVLRSRGGARLTVSLDPDDLHKIGMACLDASNRYDDEIDRRDAEGAA